jgi:protein-disulfide isomerase
VTSTPRSSLQKLAVLLTGAVLLFAAGTIGYGIVATQHSDAALTAHENPAKVSLGAPLAVGADTASTKVDIWEDVTCAQCANFENNGIGDAIRSAAWNNKIQVRYHLLTYVGDRLDSSHRAANAAACAYDQNPASFFNFIMWAFKNQPTSNETGYSPELIAKAETTFNLNNIPQFNKCVQNLSFATYTGTVNDSANADQKQGVPAIYVNGTRLTDISDANVRKTLNLG